MAFEERRCYRNQKCLFFKEVVFWDNCQVSSLSCCMNWFFFFDYLGGCTKDVKWDPLFFCIKQVLYKFDVYIKTHSQYQTIAPLLKSQGFGNIVMSHLYSHHPQSRPPAWPRWQKHWQNTWKHSWRCMLKPVRVDQPDERGHFWMWTLKKQALKQSAQTGGE